MENRVKVSVIIPVYQVEDYLERAVDSVLAQTLEEKEIILVDDGSEDTSGEICDRYARKFPDIIRVIHKENEGLGMARNTGVQASAGEYLAFLDSDDTAEPQMYETMYEKAKEGHYDIVMCDVRIIREEEGSVSEVSSYPSPQIDLADYIAQGNNITYSVNKLYRRYIWEENHYEKMLFEDIALIPALITRYPNIGYVPEAFYNYYRRANTISTTFTGSMVDIVRSFRSFIERSDALYREEVIYNTAKQLYWNMTQSRVIFQADFIGLLKEYRKDFLLNPYIEKDSKIRKLLDYIDRDVIPEQFICVHIGCGVLQDYLDRIREDFPNARLIDADETYFEQESLPECVREALAQGQYQFVQEYYALRILCEEGGIVLMPYMRASLNLKKLRLNRIFFGFEDPDSLTAGCFGALKEHYVIQALLDSYGTEHIYNKAFLPFAQRLRDFLMVHFGLNVNGRNQSLKNEVQVYLPSILAYDMKNGENCCKKVPVQVPEGYELVSEEVLRMWSERLMENWNLYKQERSRNGGKDTEPAKKTAVSDAQGMMSREVEERIREVVEAYENSTCWKITKPVRAVGRFFGGKE